MYDAERNLLKLRHKASKKIEKNQNCNKILYDKKHVKAYEYKAGDYIMIKNFDATPGVSHKLVPRYKGPYQIVKALRNDRYIIADIEGFQISQKPYQEVWEAANMRLWKKPSDIELKVSLESAEDGLESGRAEL